MSNEDKQKEQHHVLVMGAEEPGENTGNEENEESRGLSDMVEQPAKVMRIGSMIRQLLEEVKAAPLDEASRARLKEVHTS